MQTWVAELVELQDPLAAPECNPARRAHLAAGAADPYALGRPHRKAPIVYGVPYKLKKIGTRHSLSVMLRAPRGVLMR